MEEVEHPSQGMKQNEPPKKKMPLITTYNSDEEEDDDIDNFEDMSLVGENTFISSLFCPLPDLFRKLLFAFIRNAIWELEHYKRF